jgi:hypothetical protein
LRLSLAISIAAVIAGAHAAGCGSDAADCADCGTSGGPDNDGAGGGGPGPGSATSSGPGTSTGGGGDGNDTFATAEPIELDQVHTGELSPTGDVDYYSFVGTAGQVVYFNVDAQDLDGAGFDPNHIDVVLTLFDADERQIAESTGPIPRYSADPELYTVLPADGTYVVRLQECWQWSGDPAAECAAPETKRFVAYEMLLAGIDHLAFDGIVGDVEPNDDPLKATALEYAKSDTGSYYYTDLLGAFSSVTDVDVFQLALPEDTTVTVGRATAVFWPMPDGTSGNGSTTAPGRVYLVDPAQPGASWAEIDASDGQRLHAPLELGKPYLLYVEHGPDGAGANDFYVLRHYGSGSNPVEKSDASNGTAATPEPLDLVDNGDGSFSFFVDGDIAPAGVDVDHYVVDASAVPGGKVNVACSAQRRGSGLRDFTFTLLKGSNGASMPGATEMEEPTLDASIVEVEIPASEPTLLLKVEAATQAPNVTSTFYRCGVHLSPP